MRMIARIDPRIQTGADQRLHAGQRQFLELGIRQVDHLRHEVAGRDLIEILVRELDRDRVVGQIGFRAVGDWSDLERRIAFHALATREIGDLQPVDAAGREAVAARNHQRLRIEVADSPHIPGDHHGLGFGEEDLNRGRRAHGQAAHGAAIRIAQQAAGWHHHAHRRDAHHGRTSGRGRRRREHAGARTSDPRARFHQLLRGRQVVRSVVGTSHRKGSDGDERDPTRHADLHDLPPTRRSYPRSADPGASCW
jgi:hypothetical protein